MDAKTHSHSNASSLMFGLLLHSLDAIEVVHNIPLHEGSGLDKPELLNGCVLNLTIVSLASTAQNS